MQGELEHKTLKARYQRTDQKMFVKQLVCIERREARLHCIRNKLGWQREVVASGLQEHHHIGLSQNRYEHIGTFLRRNAGDPAIRVRHHMILVIDMLIFLTEFFAEVTRALASTRAGIFAWRTNRRRC